ncbi:TPA: hypothetical protein ACJJ56_002132, partial [Neisseria meningitidis]
NTDTNKEVRAITDNQPPCFICFRTLPAIKTLIFVFHRISLMVVTLLVDICILMPCARSFKG